MSTTVKTPTKVVVCPNCSTKNRVPAAADGAPRCGNCQNPLPWVVDTSDARVRAHFGHEMNRIRDARRQVFFKLGLDAVEIDTGGSFVKPIRDLFARRARRIGMR